MTATNPNSPTAPPRRSLRIVLLAIGTVVLVALVVGAALVVGTAVGGKRSDASAHYSITGSFDSVRISAKAAGAPMARPPLIVASSASRMRRTKRGALDSWGISLRRRSSLRKTRSTKSE